MAQPVKVWIIQEPLRGCISYASSVKEKGRGKAIPAYIGQAFQEVMKPGATASLGIPTRVSSAQLDNGELATKRKKSDCSMAGKQEVQRAHEMEQQ